MPDEPLDTQIRRTNDEKDMAERLVQREADYKALVEAHAKLLQQRADRFARREAAFRSEIEILYGQLNDKREASEQLEARHSEIVEIIESGNKQLCELENAQKETLGRLTNAVEHITVQNKIICEREECLKRMQAQLAYEADERLNAMLLSTSWRITAPMRRISAWQVRLTEFLDRLLRKVVSPGS